MDLTFNKDGEFYVSEFEVTADFALHIERSDVGTIQLFQNTGSSHGYAIVEDFRFDNRNKLVIDYDTPVLIPKRIRIESEVLPTYAAVTSAGEVTEIKSQAKVVEITSNGTTSVEPDAGFSYLSKVDVKTNVPTEGGGSGSNIAYYDLSGLSSYTRAAIVNNLGALIKINSIGVIAGVGYYTTNDIDITEIDAVAIISDAMISVPEAEPMKAEYILKSIEPNIVEITESEFYTLDTPNTPS